MVGAMNNGEKDEKTPRSYTEQLFKGIKGRETSVMSIKAIALDSVGDI